MTGARPAGAGGPRPGPASGPVPEPGTEPVPEPESKPGTEPGSRPPPAPPRPGDRIRPEHRLLQSLLGTWALSACSAEESAVVEQHLGGCASCAEEALRLREAVGLLRGPETLDLVPALRTQVLDACLTRRPPRVPVPGWVVPYDTEAARLDGLLRDFGSAEWHAPVRLRWLEDDRTANQKTTVAGVVAHLLAVDGLVARALGLADPLGEILGSPGSAESPGVSRNPGTPTARTRAYWQARPAPPTRTVHRPWREQSHDLVRTVSFTGSLAGGLLVPYGAGRELTLRDAMLDRAFECWLHGADIAHAVDYPYEPPQPSHLHAMIDFAARRLPHALAARRRAGRTRPSSVRGGRHLVPVGKPGRSVRLEVEGHGGGTWLIPLDSPAAVASPGHEVAHVALDKVEFCRLAAGHVCPDEAAAGQDGDRNAINDLLYATASLSRL